MTLSLLRSRVLQRRRIPRGAPRDLPPHRMRDIASIPGRSACAFPIAISREPTD